MFQRTEDQLPRGNGTLMLKIAFHDYRKRIYESLGRLVVAILGLEPVRI